MFYLDFETKDPYLACKMGPGWVYAVDGRPNVLGFEVLGMAYSYDGRKDYVTDKKQIVDMVQEHVGKVVFVMHNAAYDLGCLEVLGLDTSKLDIIDTKLMAHLYDSSLLDYSLDGLSARYTEVKKKTHILTDAVWRNDLYPWLKKELNAKAKGIERERPSEEKLEKWAYTNMDILQAKDPQAVADYAIADIDATKALCKYIHNRLQMSEYIKFLRLPQIVNSYRKRGMIIDLDALSRYHCSLTSKIALAHRELDSMAEEEFNMNSPKELPRVLDKLGIKYPTTEKGNPSITTPWMTKQNHPFLQAIVNARQLTKIDRDFLTKLRDMQDQIGEDRAMVYPELNILGARTGRFSSSNPNLQQIPGKGELGNMCRDIYLPYDGERIYSLDYSNQEGRLQIHYGFLLGCEGAALLREEFLNNPDFDMHLSIAKMIFSSEWSSLNDCEKKERRRIAKTINLGISYGMGTIKLSQQLSISQAAAQLLVDQYNDRMPFLKELSKKCMNAMDKRGFIKTILGRKLKNDPPQMFDGRMKSFSYKALNKLIQGSAADQIIAAMNLCYDNGVKVLMPIHDQLLISGNEEDARKAKHYMETAIELKVPVVVDVDMNGGDSWAQAGH